MKRLLLLFISIATISLATNVPQYTGYVNDYAHLLSDAQRNYLEQHLRQNENAGGWQIAVVTVPNLQGESIEQFANDLFQTWGIGRKGIDDGVLLIQSVNPRKVRIEVGRGNEGDLTDALSSRIIRNVIVPQLKVGNNYAGLLEGVNAIIEARPKPLTKEEVAEQARQAEAERIEQVRVAKEQKMQAISDGWKREQDAKVKQMADERFWKSFKETCVQILWFLLFTSPFTLFGGHALYKYLKEMARLRKEKEDKLNAIREAKRKEKERLEAIEEKKQRERDRAAREREAERQRIADEKERQWRKDHPAEAKEKDRLAAIAIAAAAVLAAKRRREQEEEDDRRRQRQRDDDDRRRRDDSNSSSSSSSSFGGFGGGSSNGGGASGDY